MSKFRGLITGFNSSRFAGFQVVIAYLIIAAAAVTLWIRYPVNQSFGEGQVPGDFAVYHQAWQRVSAGQNPYVTTDPSPYKYSPGILTIMGGLEKAVGSTSIDRAWFVFGSFSILLLAVGLLSGDRFRSNASLVALLLGLILSWKGILETLDYGQLELIIFGVAMLATVSLRRASPISGLLAGTLPWIKLPWVLLAFPLIVILLMRKGTKLSRFFSGYFASCFIWGAALPAMVYGSERAKELSQAWIALLKAQPESLYYSDINQSIWITANRWISQWPALGLGDSPEALLIGVGIAALILGLVVGRMTQKTAERGQSVQFSALAAIAPWLLLTQLLNPLSWRWGSVFALAAPFATLGTKGEVRRGPLRVVVMAFILTLWLLQQNPVVRALGYNHWTELHSAGVITLYWIGLLVLSF